jgi:UDPglucose 6-dehydrogenase
MRESPALTIITVLQDAGAIVVAYDPQGTEQAKQLLNDVQFTTDLYTCADGADAVVVMTEWNEFRALDFTRLRQIMRGDVLIDLRNVYNAELATQYGFAYTSVGRTSAAVLKTEVKAAE